jgi:hypothetical protein
VAATSRAKRVAKGLATSLAGSQATTAATDLALSSLQEHLRAPLQIHHRHPRSQHAVSKHSREIEEDGDDKSHSLNTVIMTL